MSPTLDHSTEEEALRRAAKEWVVHMATAQLTPRDRREFEQWRAQSREHAKAYAEALSLWWALGSPLKAARARSGRTAPRVSSMRAGPVPGRRAFLAGALSASAAGLGIMIAHPPLDLWPSLSELAADYRTGIGEQRRIALADHASIELNTRTSLNIREATASEGHLELISGEAAVTAGPTRLTLFAGNGRTSAARAQFTVREDGAAVTVTCLDGFVEVCCGDQSVTVQPRQQVVYTAQQIGAAMPVDPEVTAAWRDGLLVFDNERLSHVIEEVNRYRTGRIILMNRKLGERLVTARFKIARLDAVLTQFRAVFGAKVTQVAGGIVLLS
ncbi:FecR domain-containing protein [Bradyrhizobium sp. ARR65]|uniref:FecR family protein n=1 Tax=Bradyrhizobium sp. ARR65 TaxID=1040989 RepID=UPI0004661A44|nr:FecR domain-containing protein [Bradyrhizobium sp. ARR65]